MSSKGGIPRRSRRACWNWAVLSWLFGVWVGMVIQREVWLLGVEQSNNRARAFSGAVASSEDLVFAFMAENRECCSFFGVFSSHSVRGWSGSGSFSSLGPDGVRARTEVMARLTARRL